MKKDNPACYECPKSKDKLHTWILRLISKTSYCKKCGLELTKEQTADIWEDHN
jgi:hypothetical protein